MENFDLDILAIRRQRAARRSMRTSDPAFLHRHALRELAHRLTATNRSFFNPAILFEGPFNRELCELLIKEAGNVEAPIQSVSLPKSLGKTCNLGLAPDSLDLVISVFDLHWMNDLPGALIQINRALKPDGLFMGILPGPASLGEFREAMLRAEVSARQGAAARFDPLSDVRQLGDVLQRTGFRLTVVDKEEISIRYNDIESLISDLRSAGATSTISSSNPGLTREILTRARRELDPYRDPVDKKFPVTAQMVFMTGWKSHESQQKPSKPGSATHSLADALVRK